MDTKKEDRRIRITKLAIQESLVELMNTLPISKISVKMLCEAADINRSTFYAHYKDQYDLLKSVQRNILAQVKEKISSTQVFADSDSAVAVLAQELEFARQNASLLTVLLSDNGDPEFQGEIMQLVQEKIMEEFQGEKSIPPRTVKYLKRFILSGLLSITRHWLNENCADKPEVMAELMINLIVHGATGLYVQK